MSSTAAAPDFARLASHYDAWYATPVGAWADRHEMATIFRLLALQPGERLLDIGAGAGRYAAAAVRYGVDVVGVDASEAMVDVARQRTAGLPVQFMHADAARLPFPTASFDVALAVTMLCFVADPFAVLCEAARVLRPGGRLVLGELNRWSLWALQRRLKGLVRPTIYRTAHFHSIRELSAMLMAAGFTPLRWEGVLHLPPLNHAGVLRMLEPLEGLGQRRFPAVGAFLAIEAHRRDNGDPRP